MALRENKYFQYFVGVVILLGLIGNILSIIVFWRCRSKDHVTVTYLAPLAAADLGALFYGAYTWIVNGVLGKTNGYYFFEDHFSPGAHLLCKLFRYQHRVCSCISSYLILLFSVERCLGVWFPMHVHIAITNKRRKITLGLMMFSMLLLNIPILLYFRIHYWGSTMETTCLYDVPEFTNLQKYFLIEINYNIIPHTLPCFLILIINILIILGVWFARREASANLNKGKNRVKSNNSLISLLFVSLLYVITTLPYVILWGMCNYLNYIAGKWVGFSPEEIQLILMVGFFTTSFLMVNYCFNFLIYACSLNIFKNELRCMFGKKNAEIGIPKF
jgi:thyrotropin-releasing hormone receptor